MRISVDKAVKLANIEVIGTFPTPDGQATYWKENGKCVVEIEYVYGNKSRYVFDSYEDACYEISSMYY